MPSAFGEDLKSSGSVCRGAIPQRLLGCPLPSDTSPSLLRKLARFCPPSSCRPPLFLPRCSPRTTSPPVSPEDAPSSTLTERPPRDRRAAPSPLWPFSSPAGSHPPVPSPRRCGRGSPGSPPAPPLTGPCALPPGTGGRCPSSPLRRPELRSAESLGRRWGGVGGGRAGRWGERRREGGREGREKPRLQTTGQRSRLRQPAACCPLLPAPSATQTRTGGTGGTGGGLGTS